MLVVQGGWCWLCLQSSSVVDWQALWPKASPIHLTSRGEGCSSPGWMRRHGNSGEWWKTRCVCVWREMKGSKSKLSSVFLCYTAQWWIDESPGQCFMLYCTVLKHTAWFGVWTFSCSYKMWRTVWIWMHSFSISLLMFLFYLVMLGFGERFWFFSANTVVTLVVICFVFFICHHLTLFFSSMYWVMLTLPERKLPSCL